MATAKGKLVLHQWQVHRSMHQVWPVATALVTAKKSIGKSEAAAKQRQPRETPSLVHHTGSTPLTVRPLLAV